MGKRHLFVYFLLLAFGVIAIRYVNVDRGYDIRRHPLARPIAVCSLSDDGLLHLSDGRTFRPAVLFPTESKARQAALEYARLAVKQGVELRTDLGDGSALFTCEPRFYNWCGTGPVRGWYVPCGLSELLISSGHAAIDPAAKVSEHDAERLRVASEIAREQGHDEHPTHTISTGIRCMEGEQEIAAMDELIETQRYPKMP